MIFDCYASETFAAVRRKEEEEEEREREREGATLRAISLPETLTAQHST